MRWAWIPAVLALLAVAATAVGQEDGSPPAPDFDDAEARGLFEAGRAAFQAGRFDDALGHFQRAYELSQRPVLLFNVASSLDRLRRDREAIDMFERYLAGVPTAVNRQEVEGRVRVLRESMREAEERERIAVERARAGEEDPDEGVLSHDFEDNDAMRPEPEGERVWTWVALAGTVALGGAATAFWLMGDSEFDDLQSSCGGSCPEDDLSTLKTLDTLATVFLITSAAAGVGAITLFFVEGGDDDETAMALDAGPTGLSLRGRF